MKRICNFLIILLVVINCSIISVNAKETECKYGDELTLTYKESGPKINQQFYPNVSENYILWQEKSGDINNETYIADTLTELYDGCPSKIYYCKLERLVILGDVVNKLTTLSSNGYSSTVDMLSQVFNVASNTKEVYLFATKKEADNHSVLKNYEEGNSGGWQLLEIGKNIYTSFGNKDYESVKESIVDLAKNSVGSILTFLGEVEYVYKECGSLDYTGDKDIDLYNLACPNLFQMQQKFQTALTKYKECSAEDAACKSERMSLINEREKQMKSYCSNIIENYDFDNSTGEDCLKDCFNIGKYIITEKEKENLLSTNVGECGLSSRLIAWGLNIMRWGKYIIPIIVIILSILEFIKVIGTGKEDEMKKVQGRFIRRIIAAALIFVVPLIIEFALDKFGFTEYIDGCGIIEEIE